MLEFQWLGTRPLGATRAKHLFGLAEAAVGQPLGVKEVDRS